MKYPTVFVNHGGGPMPLLGRQPNLVSHMKELVHSRLPSKPKAIILLSAHWEADPVEITSSPKPPMLFDYYGFPPETYEYNYAAPGSPDLAQRIKTALQDTAGIPSKLNPSRGYDHGVFVPLMTMFPDADIPVVCVSMHSSLDAGINMSIGRALQQFREEGTLIVGSGQTFHNMRAMFNPSQESAQASNDFNGWLKETLLGESKVSQSALDKLAEWDKLGPGARLCHPREEHLIPLFMAAAAAGADSVAELVMDTTTTAKEGGHNLAGGPDSHALTGYVFN